MPVSEEGPPGTLVSGLPGVAALQSLREALTQSQSRLCEQGRDAAGASSAPTAEAAAPDTVWRFCSSHTGCAPTRLDISSFLVARRFYDNVQISEGEHLEFRPHKDQNKYDCLVAEGCAGIVGQLPQKLAAALQPLLPQVKLSGMVTSVPSHSNAVVPVDLVLAVSAEPGRPAPDLSAVANAASAVRDQVREGTGNCLRRNFAVMVTEVEDMDGHLLDVDDRALVLAYAACAPSSQALLLRLMLRTRTWYREAALAYADVPDVEAAVRDLATHGLLERLAPDPAWTPPVAVAPAAAAAAPRTRAAAKAARAAAPVSSGSLLRFLRPGTGAAGAPVSPVGDSIDRQASDAPLARSASTCTRDTQPCGAACGAAVDVNDDATILGAPSPFEGQQPGMSATPRPAHPCEPRTGVGASQGTEATDRSDAIAGSASPSGDISSAGRSTPGAADGSDASNDRQNERGAEHAADGAASPRSSAHDSVAAVMSVTTASELTGVLRGYCTVDSALGVSGLRRAEIESRLERLATSDDERRELLQRLLRVVGPCVALSRRCRATLTRIQRIFLLNEAHTVQQFLLAERGVVRWPSYKVHRSRSPFASRSQLLEYERALEVANEVDNHIEAGCDAAALPLLQQAAELISQGCHKRVAWHSGVEPSAGGLTCPLFASCDAQREGVERTVPLFLARFHASWVYAELATMYVAHLERSRRYPEACELLQRLLEGAACPLRRGHWWCRLAINMKRKDELKALTYSEAALGDPWVRGGARLSLQLRVLALSKASGKKAPRRWRVPAWKAAAEWLPLVLHVNASPVVSGVGAGVGIRNRYVSLKGPEQVTVEELVLEHFAQPEHGEWKGIHCENGIWSTLFTLLMWDVLFADVPDVFRTPFQTAPLDLGCDAFMPARQALVDACLARIAAGAAVDMLQKTWDEQCGVLCRGVQWARFPLDMLLEVVQCVGGRGLAAILRCLAEDYSGWMSGMPDLLLWRPRDSMARLVEVKGPTDVLSHQQRAWLHAMHDAGLDAAVCKVAPR